MKKKMLSVLLCMVITAGMLAGCGSSTSDTAGSSAQTEASQEAAESTAQTEAVSESGTQTEASAETAETDGEKIVVTIGDFPNKEADPALWEVYQGYVEKFKEIRPDVEIIQDEKSYSVDSFATTAATGDGRYRPARQSVPGGVYGAAGLHRFGICEGCDGYLRGKRICGRPE